MQALNTLGGDHDSPVVAIKNTIQQGTKVAVGQAGVVVVGGMSDGEADSAQQEHNVGDGKIRMHPVGGGRPSEKAVKPVLQPVA